MSMDYYLYSDLATDTDHDFPSGLSYFFEQLGGYGVQSMVAQTSKLLKIDLGLFQKVSHPEEPGLDIIHPIEAIQKVVTAFIARVHANPNFIEKIRFGPAGNFPPDTGYLKRGGLLKDLVALEKRLNDLKAAGATKIKLMYM